MLPAARSFPVPLQAAGTATVHAGADITAVVRAGAFRSEGKVTLRSWVTQNALDPTPLAGR